MRLEIWSRNQETQHACETSLQKFCNQIEHDINLPRESKESKRDEFPESPHILNCTKNLSITNIPFIPQLVPAAACRQEIASFMAAGIH